MSGHRFAVPFVLAACFLCWSWPSAQALAATGSVAGTVTDASTGLGISGIQVYASLADGSGPSPREAVTRADGTYVVTGMGAGTYILAFHDQDGAANGDYADEWYLDNVCQDFFDPVVVSDGASVTGIDVALSGCGTIHGWIEGDGARLLGAFAQAFCWVQARQEWEWYPLEFQDVDPDTGEYSLERVRAGQWALHFGDHGAEFATAYAGEFYPDAHFVQDAQMVLVTPGSSVFVKGDLDLGGTLRGRVFDRSGTPLAGGMVALYDWDPDKQQWGWAGMETPTWADGSYLMDGLDTWTYRLQFFPPEGSTLASEYWYNSAELDGALDLTWSVGQVREGYDAWLGTPDAAAPVTSLSGLPASAWSRLPVRLTLIATDSGSGVELTQYRLDGGAWAAGTSVVLPAPSTHVGDGAHVFEYRSADYCGNWEQARTRSVHIDTTRPVPLALAGVTVRRGQTARLRYKVVDASPKCNVRILIANGRRQTVKQLVVAAAKTNVTLTKAFRCQLAKGAYSWCVYATDLARNTQAEIAARKLTVR